VGPRVTLAALLVAALAGAAGVARADNPTLTGVVGTNDQFQLSLSDASGPVKHVSAGTYTLVVHDRSTFHNFHFFGPGVDVATTVDEVADKTFTVTLADGTYTFQCDAHLPAMKATFTVGAASAPPPPAQKLSGSITGSKATLSSISGLGGLAPGKATVTITDRSKTDGFFLQGPGVVKKTGAGFTGKVSWTVTFQAGTYRWGSARRPAARRSFTVSPA
jgi:plastocyanin